LTILRDVPNAVGYYSLLRFVPDPIRGEGVNIGLFLTDSEGRWARLETRSARAAIRAVGTAADIDRIERWVQGVREQFHVFGDEGLLAPPGRISPEVLAEWAHSFGGGMQVGEPRVAVGESLPVLWDQLFNRLVVRRAQPREAPVGQQVMVQTAADERRLLVAELETQVRRWPNFDAAVFRLNSVFRGNHAEHITDVAFVNHQVRAVANVIPVAHGDVVDVIRARALLADAALDLDAAVTKLALVDEPEPDRDAMLEEVAAVFNELPAGHRPSIVSRANFGQLEQQFGQTLFVE
jgi:hypothetical protein